MHTIIDVKSHAARLREALDGLGHQLKHSKCLEAISQLEGYPDWNTQTAEIIRNQGRAEQFLDEMIEAEQELSYAKFTRRFEKKYLVGFLEHHFQKDMREIREEIGNYISREFLGCVSGKQVEGDNRYPNLVRYVWRGVFDKNEVLITVGIYSIDGNYYVCEARYR